MDDFIRLCRPAHQGTGICGTVTFLPCWGACRIGEKRLLEFLDSVAEGTFEAFAKDWMNYSERRMALALSELPEGKTRVTIHHDPVPGAEDGVPINVDLTVHPSEARVEVDLRDNIDCQPFGMNLSEIDNIFSSNGRGIFQHAPAGAL